YSTEGTLAFADYITELHWSQHFAYLNREEMMDRFARCLSDFMAAEVVEAERINCHHNYTVKEEHFSKQVWLTRKGAVLADVGVKALIPGSMGTRSYVVEGKGYAPSLRSAQHGSGRFHARRGAWKVFTTEGLDKRMEGIVYRPGKAWIDEIPDAYKDIDQVMADDTKLVDVQHELRQVLNVKGT